MTALLIAFSTGDEEHLSTSDEASLSRGDDTSLSTSDRAPQSVVGDDGTVRLTIDGETHALSREEALALRAAIGDALEWRRDLIRTVGHYRRDGTYAVARRCADTPGNEQVFDSLSALQDLFAAMPTEFGAADVGDEGPTGSRRHLVVRHLAEHPAFDCRLVSERPLRAEKGAE